MNKKNIPELLSKKVLGTLSSEEKEILDRWTALRQENRTLAGEIVSEEYIRSETELYSKIDITSGLRGVILKRRRRHARRMFIRTAAAAAVLALMLALPFYLKNVLTPAENIIAIEPGTVKAELILSDNSSVQLVDSPGHILINDGQTTLLNDGSSLSYEDNASESQLVYNILRVPHGGKYSVTLSDGTLVTMNSESELRYPVSFPDGERRITLSGEAYFDVSENAEKPFIVEFGGSQVRVLGTSFNIRAYPDRSRMFVTLASGSIVYSGGGVERILEPSDRLTVLSDGSIHTTSVDTSVFSAWKEGLFAYHRSRLEDILDDMSRWYDIDVVWRNESSKDIMFSGTIEDRFDFHRIARIFQTTGIDIDVTGNTVTIR